MPPPTRHLRIAFYAPLKAPTHPVPSGDRLMAQLLTRCLTQAGHQVDLASDLRAYLGDPQDLAGWTKLRADADDEAHRISTLWANDPPDLWLCYHPYYKSPDMLGPNLAHRFALPYVTVEASLSARRNIGIWTEMQAQVGNAVQQASLNLCLTARDRNGLHDATPTAHLARFPPFIETDVFSAPATPQPGHLVTVAMMRAGDKRDSYRRLAATLALLPPGLHWHLSVIGDGPQRAEVQAMFADLPPNRLTWLGLQTQPQIAATLTQASAYIWPGCGEAYGLAYLEAQAAGVPVIAQRTAGVPEVVTDGETGFLTEPGDDAAAATAITRLLTEPALQRRMGQAARLRVQRDHSITGAAQRLNTLLQTIVEPKP
ncbi:MAG: glycosyltransferase family 4 protein [Cypionkella sp.]|uniref:glycosyltransferase family 4 protein n=1 Tax=Cypionkella sp. TaxID=2811411 RepID=UPI002ABAED4D|nr:glycosyltransferase family 4 protein [Cypionkella sp.]MDZ4310581.1 glycosyltransferase family 4 protein [Cypionkella sp.]